MKRLFSICLCFTILALCVAPLFFPNDAKANQPTVHATDLQATDKGIDYDSLPDGGAATDAAAEAAAQAEATDAQAPDQVAPAPTVWESLKALFKEHWAAIVAGFLGFIEILVRITPSEKDNAWFKWIKALFDSIIPNLKKGGGTHPPA